MIVEGRLAGAEPQVPLGPPAGDDGGDSRPAGVPTQVSFWDSWAFPTFLVFSEAIVNQLNQRLLGKSLAAKVENRSNLGIMA